MNLSVRELEQKDIPELARYWTDSDEAHMLRMGVEISKLPTTQEWHDMLGKQLEQDYRSKQSFCTIWNLDGRAIGHSNVNKIIYGDEAYMHLHIWYPEYRRKGLGRQFLPLSIRLFFDKLELKKIYCEPAAFNEAPNHSLPHLGFELEKTYTTVPGFICFEQPVNRWFLTKERFDQQFNTG